MSAWNDWANGVLNGIAAPVSDINLNSLWNWSNKESGADVMRWNNPLNTTQELMAGVDVDPDMNRVGVESYPTVADGVAATVATLTNGLYGNIIGALQTNLPHQQWGTPAVCTNLNKWGTGCNWLTMNLPTEGGTMHTIDELYAYLESVYSSLNSATQILAGDLATLQAKVDALAPASAAKPLNITLSGTATP